MTWEELQQMQQQMSAGKAKNQGVLAQNERENMKGIAEASKGDPLLGAVGSIAGGVAGGMVGGPIGASLGSSLGGQLGGSGTVDLGQTLGDTAKSVVPAATGAISEGVTTGLTEFTGAQALQPEMVDGQSMVNLNTPNGAMISADSEQAKMLMKEDDDFLTRRFFAKGGRVQGGK